MLNNNIMGHFYIRFIQGLLALSLSLVHGAVSAQGSPTADAVVLSVNSVGNGRYDFHGMVLDSKGLPANGLAMASGRCVFTSGPGAMRCEGGNANLPLGEFELFNLPTEADGTLKLQAFVQGHVSYAEKIDPDDYDGPEQPPAGDIATYKGNGKQGPTDWSACATLSADAMALVSVDDSKCDGKHSLDIKVEIDPDGIGEAHCVVSYDTDNAIPIENGGFKIIADTGELITGQFVSANQLAGTAFDEHGCGGSWSANLVQ